MDSTADQNDINQFWTIYPELPSDIKKAIFSADNAKIVQKLTEQYSLEDHSVSKLANIVGDVLLGLSNTKDVKTRLKEAYSLSDELADRLNGDLQELIFEPLQGNLKKLSYLQNSRPGKLRDIYGELVE